MKKKSVFKIIPWYLVLFLSYFLGVAADLPVKVPVEEGYKEVPENSLTRRPRGIRNLFTIGQIHEAIQGGFPVGLQLDFTGKEYIKLLDGGTINPTRIYGRVYMGPYPFEAGENDYTYKRFKLYSGITNGKAVLPVKYLLGEGGNSEDWTDQGQVMVRISLWLKEKEEDQNLGTYDTIVRFMIKEGRFVKGPTIIEGPMVNMIRSEAYDQMVISFRTNETVESVVVLDNGKRFSSRGALQKHEIKVSGLQSQRTYRYYVELGSYKSKAYTFLSAPPPGKGDVVFAYSGDSRAGAGGGDYNFMGVNYSTLERNANLAFREKAGLFIFGGDLINGNTASVEDFRTQIYAWKQALAGFWHYRPVYACMGNHEALLRVFGNDRGHTLRMDRWPYDTESAEAVFDDELVHPQNSPHVSDSRRPSYKENVYSFQYGPVKFIAFNNNYWITKSVGPVWQIPQKYGGSPEGYIMPDQLDWIETELQDGEKDPSVKYIILFAQEPIFPNGGHIKDCMWYNGNNNARAFTYDPGSEEVKPEKKGIIEVRNDLVRMVGKCRKVAAVMGSDEHSYHKVLIDNDVPVGVPSKDDRTGNGLVCKDGETCSAIKDLKYPTWYLVSGGSGAPYYSEEKTPWNRYWKKNPNRYKSESHTSMKGCYYYSSQENVMIFKAGSRRISVIVYNPYGEIIDKIDDLMAVKNPAAQGG